MEGGFSMHIIYPNMGHFEFSSNGNIYLAGENNDSWKNEALAYLQEHRFQGNVYLSNMEGSEKDVAREYTTNEGFSWHSIMYHNCEAVVYWSNFDIPWKWKLDKALSAHVILGSFKHLEFRNIDILMEETMRRVNEKVQKRQLLKRY